MPPKVTQPSPTGLSRWLYTTNHKDMGTLYLIFSGIMLLVGGMMAELMRAQMLRPGALLFNPDTYNVLVTFHGIIMIFGVALPALIGLGNWMVPLMIGAPDMALPRLNNWSFWILPFAFAILLSTLFMSGGAPNFGWTMYAPLSTHGAPPSTDFLIIAFYLIGFSSLLTAINMLATILNLRVPGMSLMKMPLFVWTWLITAFLLIIATPILTGTMTMILFDRHFGTSFFDAAGGGDPVLYQHIFWFFAHPELYVMILPSVGIISEIIPTFSCKKLLSYPFMVAALVSMAILSLFTWGQHMFTSGLTLHTQLFFMYTTLLVALPTGVLLFNWIATLYRGALTFETPMLFAIAFVFLFTIGELSGLMQAIVPADFQYADTYFSVAQLHYALVGGTLFAIFAGIYYWLPKWTGNYYRERLGQWHFWLTLVGTNLTFFPMYFLGLAGMPNRVPDYALQFADFQKWVSLGAFLFGAAQVLLIVNIVLTYLSGRKAAAKAWENAQGLEWTVPSPAPYQTFQNRPKKFKGT